jgi:hypothetical protein
MSFNSFLSKKFAIFCIVITTSLLLPFSFSFTKNTTNAQTNAVKINTIPQHPGPFTTATIIVEDYSRDLNKLNISWSVDGKVVQSGVGLKRLQTTTGALGTITTVSINMAGDVQQVVLRPGVVDLLWQSDTYTPPFYDGKALHTNQNQLTVVAEPFFITQQGARLDPTKLIYQWKKNGTLDNSASGYGKRVFRISPSIFMRPTNVEVEVSSADKTFQTISSISIPESKAEVMLYENQPLYGINFSSALNEKERTISDQEIRVIGIPFFFSNQEKTNNNLSFTWSLNNTPINQAGSEVIFRKPDGSGTGRSLVSLNIKNSKRAVQNATSNFYTTFQGETEGQTTF